MEAIQLLIAEDQDLIRKSLGIVLGMTPGIEVAGMAENGQVAITQAESLQPDVILMDIHMPVMDGVEATAIIKQRWPEIRIIILTTFQEIDYVTAALNAGAEGYILKAIDPMDLASAVQLVHRGEMMITQEVARSLFAHHIAGSREVKPLGTAKGSIHGLTERELQVLQYISEGLVNRFIAERMFLSEGTVKNYISSIYSKLGVQNRASAMRKAAEEGLL
ncbi:DNA-binding response regulator [Bacillus sp. FJAT-27264]|uniref:response regulator transcription factor n=1 Tax=Paenibacillus sp. (strain DSM 101736 / FJAT-27264) TaxID=1850362 RepID=UPI000807CF96|nr:response regulator transcription factor [Bacillus sp. FJAT-27264]OBZ10681.1 DNA-binding response regulator [Bacillus sp. FJAT-27264]